jgi:hypothetical protein
LSTLVASRGSIQATLCVRGERDRRVGSWDIEGAFNVMRRDRQSGSMRFAPRLFAWIGIEPTTIAEAGASVGSHRHRRSMDCASSALDVGRMAYRRPVIEPVDARRLGRVTVLTLDCSLRIGEPLAFAIARRLEHR